MQCDVNARKASNDALLLEAVRVRDDGIVKLKSFAALEHLRRYWSDAIPTTKLS